MAKKTTNTSKPAPEAVTSGAYQPEATVRVKAGTTTTINYEDTVRVKAGTTINYEDKTYTEGDTLAVPSRTAEHWVLAGQVEVTQ